MADVYYYNNSTLPLRITMQVLNHQQFSTQQRQSLLLTTAADPFTLAIVCCRVADWDRTTQVVI